MPKQTTTQLYVASLQTDRNVALNT